MPRQLIRTDIDPDHTPQINHAARHIHVVIGLPQFRANRQNPVSRQNQRPHRVQRRRGWHRQRRLPHHNPATVHRLHHWRIQHPRQSPYRAASAQGSAASQDHHPARRVQQICGLCHQPRIRARPHRHRTGYTQVSAGQQHHIGRDLQMHRPWPPDSHRRKRPVQRRSQPGSC